MLQANSVVALRHGILTGTLPQTFEMLKAEAIDRRHSANHDASKIRFYWLIIGVVLLLLLVQVFFGLMFLVILTMLMKMVITLS